MPDFAVTTVFGVKDNLTSFFAGAEKSAGRFESAVGAAFKNSSHEAGLFSKILGGVTLGNLAAKGAEKGLEFLKDIPEQLTAMAEKGENLARTSKIIGVSTDALQRFDYAAKMSDVSVEGMQGALQKMNKGLGELRVHQGPLESGLKRINPQLMMQLRTAKDSQSAFLMVADAMAKTESPQKRAAIATAVFGKAGQDMIPLLLKGKEGVAQLMAETDKYAGIMDDEAIASSEKFAEAMKHTNGVMQSLKNSAVTPLLEAITPYLDELVEWINQNKNLLKQDIKGFVTGFMQGVKVAVPILHDVLWVVKTFGPAVLASVVAFNALKYGMLAVAAASKIFALVNTIMFAFQAVTGGACTAQEALNLVMDANPIALVCTAIAVAVGLFALLSKNMGGVGNAAMFLGQTILKALLLPVNLVLEGVRGLIFVIGKLPGMNKVLGPALDAVTGFQDKMNKALTGSAGALDFKGTYEANLAPDKRRYQKDVPEAGQEAINAHISHSTPTKVINDSMSRSAPPKVVNNYISHNTPSEAVNDSLSRSAPAKVIITDFLGQKNSPPTKPTMATSSTDTPRRAPNEGAIALQAHIGGPQVYVDNSKAEGVETKVRTAQPVRNYMLGHNK